MGTTGVFWFSRKQDERNRYYHGFGYCSVYCKINDKIYRYTEWQTNPPFKSNFNDAICLGYGTWLGTKVEFDYENSDVIENPDMIKRGNDMNQSEAKIGMKIRIVKDNVWKTPIGTILTIDHNGPVGDPVMSDGNYYLPERYEPAYNFAIGDEAEVINWSTTYDGKRDVVKEIDYDGVTLENYGWFPFDNVKKVEEKKVVFKPGDRVKIAGKCEVSPWISFMDRLIGKMGKIVEKSPYSTESWSVKVNGEDFPYWMNPSDFELFDDGIDQTGTPITLNDWEEAMPLIKSEETKMDIKEAYAVMQKASGIEVGDEVKVLRIAKDSEMGWSVGWEPRMNETVGRIGVVKKLETNLINVMFDMDTNWNYPFFVLEIVSKRVEKKENETLELSDIPTRVLMEIRDKYTKILDKGIDNWNRDDDWSSANCAMCRYMGRDARGITKCGRCPITVGDWCKEGNAITSKLNPSNKRGEWAGNVAEFLCKINKEIARR